VRWLAAISLAKAVKLALIWPAFVIGVLVLLLAVFLVKTREGWVIHYEVSSNIPGPGWIAVTIVVLVLLLGPPFLFLAVWRFAHSSVHSATS